MQHRVEVAEAGKREFKVPRPVRARQDEEFQPLLQYVIDARNAKFTEESRSLA